jgi:FkbM family methyltransferase
VITRFALELLTLYLRRTPLDNGRWRLIPLALRWASSTLAADGRRVIRTRHGFRMRLTLGDWGGRHLYATGEYEPGTGELVHALLRPGDTFVDVGANSGYFTLLAARRVGPRGRVFAFEPVPLTRAGLHDNLRLNRAGNVTVREEALADLPGDAEFFVGPADHRGTSSLRPIEAASETIHVRKARLDDLGLPGPVRAIKIDIEGAELLALRGMTELLRRDHPDLIVEVTDSFLRSMSHSAAALCEFLRGLGYRMYVIGHDGVTPAEPGRGDLPEQFNALFTARPELPTEVSRGPA